MTFAVLFSVAQAADVEEVVVWGDRFARWRQRWSVETEVHFAEPLVLYGLDSRQLELVAVQIRLELSCRDDDKQTATINDVFCDVQDIGLVGLPRLRGDLDVLRHADAMLSEARIQLQVSADGHVSNVDIEGIRQTSDLDRQRVEALRQLIRPAVLPFHIELPMPVHDDMSWQEARCELFAMPSDQGWRGGTTVAHFLNSLDDDHFVIQSIGKATVRFGVPVDYATEGTNSVGDGNDLGLWTQSPDQIYEGELTGVAILDKATGILSERVWAVRAAPTASSVNALVGPAWYHAGRLRMLAAGDHVDVGATTLAARPDGRGGRSDLDRPAWVALAP